MAAKFGSLRVLVGLALLAACGDSSGQGPGSAGSPDGGAPIHPGDAAASAGDGASAAQLEAGGAVADATSATGADAALTTDAATACAAYGKAYCEQYAACAALTFTALAYGSVDECETRILPLCMAELSAPGTARTVSVTAACGAGVAADSCADFLLTTPAACRGVGSLANGEGCEFDSQCQSTHCATPNNAWCGQCASRIAAGSPCEDDPPGCDYGLICPNSQLCTAPAQTNEACSDSTFCAPPDVCLQGICSAPIALGAACGDSPDCAGAASCLSSSNASTKTCTAVNYAAQANAACDYSSTYCIAPLGCFRVTDGGGTDTCLPMMADGKPCASGTQCEQPSLCISGTCTNVVDAASCH